MRFIRNQIQTPKLLVPVEKRKSLPFIILLIGVGIMIIGVAGFFSAFFFNELIEARWPVRYRDVQTASLVIAGCGMVLYIISALILKVPLRKTTYYKVNTIVKGLPFDPPRKGDFSRAIFARLRDLSDEWAYFMEVKPPDCDFVIPQVLVGPGGVFTSQPISENAERKGFKDPGPEFEKASKKLGNAIGQPVLPVTILSNPKMVVIYKTYCKPKTRVMNMREIYDFFDKHKQKYSEAVQKELEQKVYDLIAGTEPGK
jgi:hypothetical protein